MSTKPMAGAGQPARWELAAWRLHDALELLARRDPRQAEQVADAANQIIARRLSPQAAQELRRRAAD